MSYWEERFTQLEEAQNRTAVEYQKQAEKALEQAQRKIDYEIEVWFNRMAINNNISMTEAKRLLTSKEFKEFKWDVKDYIKYGEENALNEMWMKELENASARYHISRLEALKLKTQHQFEVVYGNQLDSIDDMMRKVYTDNYYHTCYEIQKGLHIGWDIGEINERKLNKVLKNPWATDGKTFSDRIWTKKNQMVGELHQQMTRQIIQGKSPNVAIKEMQKYVDSSIKNAKYTASRLVMTEQAFISSASTKDSYHDLDVEMYEILATLDSRTSEICQNLDGEVFPTKEYTVGATAPPFHVNCRTTTIPHFDDNYTGERIARDEDGKTYYVPDSMKYKDWKECFVDKTKDPSEFYDIIAPSGLGVEIALGIKKSETLSISDALKGTNPNYSTGSEYEHNCQRCVQAYELRRRGYNVEALPNPSKDNTILWGSECFTQSGEQPHELFTFRQTMSQVKRELESVEDGARYCIYIRWRDKKDYAHVFVAEKINGVVKYIDPQSGSEDMDDLLLMGQTGKFGFFRMDDKPITTDEDVIKATVKGVE